ncbi:MAG: transposase, partial [Planctomycetes bacterium]|nr:transposase [Planctomycetota bacterium]
VDRVFPQVPVRQWVLSMPHAVRFYLAKDAKLLTGVLKIFIDEIFRDYRRRARLKGACCGGVTAIQRFGGAVNLNCHFHSLLLDGVYARDESSGGFRFRPAKEPSQEGIERLAWVLREKILGYLSRKGCFVGGDSASEAASSESQAPTLFDAMQAAAVREWTAFSDPPRPVPKIGQREEWSLPPIPEKALCARAEGFSLHGAVRMRGSDRAGLEKLCRYVLRPPFAEDRIERLGDGRIAYGFRRRRPDGSTHVVLEPLQFLEKLAALVPPPRAHLLRYHGVLAPHSALRRAVIPREETPGGSGGCGHGKRKDPEAGASGVREADARPALPEASAAKDPPKVEIAARSEPGESGGGASSPPSPAQASGEHRRRGPPEGAAPAPGARPRYYDWATLMKRGMGLDVLSCPRCSGRMKVIAAIEEPDLISKILRSMGLPDEALPRRPARPLPQSTFEFDQ